MKTTSRIKLIILILIFIVLNNRSYSQNNTSDSVVCLEIKGKVLNLGNKSDDEYKAELIYFNTVIKIENIDVNKSFKYLLKKDAIYTIRISKEGYLTKLISIYTKLPKVHDNLYKLEFETDLIPEHKSKKLNPDAIDFPITIIYYDEIANWFYFNEEYTSNIKRQLHNMKVVRNKI